MASSVTVKTKGQMNKQHRPMHFDDKNEKNETKFFQRQTTKEIISPLTRLDHRCEGQHQRFIETRSSRCSSPPLIPMHRQENKSSLIHLRSNSNIVVAQPSERNIFSQHCPSSYAFAERTSISFPDADQSDRKMSCT